MNTLKIPSIIIEKIPAKLENKILLFNPQEIDYIEAQDNNTYIYVNGQSFLCTYTISYAENKLKCFGFFRNHRSYLVNLQKVREVVTWSRNTFSLILNDKSKSSIPISKARLADLKKIINI